MRAQNKLRGNACLHLFLTIPLIALTGPSAAAGGACEKSPSSWDCRLQANCALFDKKPDCSAGMTGKEAEELLLKLKSESDLIATGFLALAYEAGFGIPQDLSKALDLYDLAIGGGNRSRVLIEGRERTLFLLNGGKYEDWSGR